MPTNETPATTRLDPSVQAIRRIARMRLLQDVPFQYLVPTEEALPVESLRFFHIDQKLARCSRGWRTKRLYALQIRSRMAQFTRERWRQ